MKNQIKVLYFFPDNPLLKNAGNKTRVLNLLNYFKSRNILVDFVSIDYNDFKKEEEKFQFIESGLINDLTILKRKPNKNNILKYFLAYKLPKIVFEKKGIFKNIGLYPKKQFNKLIENKQYDYIVITYITAMNLIDRKYTKNAKIILDTQDILTANYQYFFKKSSLGASFQQEIEIANKADEIWAISQDEYYIFNQFCNKNVKLISSWEENNLQQDFVEKKYDLLYIASDNRHNINSCHWFFSNVYHQLPSSITICVIGKITNYVKDYPNVTKIEFVENLNEYYQKTKIAICPILSGTGVKIKVIEALSYGLPIVCTLRGIDGLSNKTNNGCWVAENEKEFSEHIVHLLNDSKLYEKYKKQSENFFVENYSTETGYKILDQIFI